MYITESPHLSLQEALVTLGIHLFLMLVMFALYFYIEIERLSILSVMILRNFEH